MYYAVLDTNVLVSAMLKAKSNPGEVVIRTLTGSITPVLNQDILTEYNEVLRRKKFKFKEDFIAAVIDGLVDKAIFVDRDMEYDTEIFPDPKDIVFFEVVMEARKDRDAYLVTGNMKHFPVKTFIVTPAELLSIMNKEQQ